MLHSVLQSMLRSLPLPVRFVVPPAAGSFRGEVSRVALRLSV
ncbi:hypothetical protein [Mycobacterium sp.]|nr:hypothetical protein [Mycobacterium sp.]